MTDDRSAEAGRKRARAREVCRQTCLGLSPATAPLCPESFLMGNAHLTILTFPFFVSFTNACLKPVTCLEASCPSLAKMDMNFPGGCNDQILAPQDLAVVPGAPSHHPQNQRWDNSLGWATMSPWQREWTGTEEAETFQFSLSLFTQKVICGKSLWFLCTFLLDKKGTILGADPAPSTPWPWAIACLVGSPNPACLYTASAHPSAPPQRVVPSLLVCCEA